MRLLRGAAPVIVLAAAATALGFWGYSRAQPELNGWDTLYQTLQLYSIQGVVPESGVPWQLEVARFLAPLAVVYAVLVAFFTVATEHVQRWRTRWFARGHTLVVGDGPRAQHLIRSLGTSRRVVAVKGEARDEDTLRAYRAGHAADILIATEDDTLNLEVLASLRACVLPERPVAIHVQIDEPATWAALHRVPLLQSGTHRRIEFVSVPDRSARHLVESARGRVSGLRKLVVYGRGHTAARVVVHALRSPLAAERPEVVLAGPDAERTLQHLAAHDPWVLEKAEVVIADSPSSWNGAGLALVCGLAEAEALGAAIALAGHIDAAATIHVSVGSGETEKAFLTAGIDLSRIELAPGGEALVGEDLLRAATFEQIARERHEVYVREQLARGDDPARNSSLKPWSELDEELRESNRDFADGVADALSRLGAELVPLTGRAAGELAVPAETLDDLAEVEHKRWMRDLERRGWRHGPEKDERQKLHPCLVPWNELGEEDREKDRDSIRALPQLLAVAGYELRI